MLKGWKFNFSNKNLLELNYLGYITTNLIKLI